MKRKLPEFQNMRPAYDRWVSPRYTGKRTRALIPVWDPRAIEYLRALRIARSEAGREAGTHTRGHDMARSLRNRSRR